LRKGAVGGERGFDAVLSTFRRGDGYDEASFEPEKRKKMTPTRSAKARTNVMGFDLLKDRETAMMVVMGRNSAAK